MKSSTRIFLAFVSGVAVGTVAGILFAPDTGKNTRGKLSYQLDRYLLKLRELVGEKAAGPLDNGEPSPSDISRADRKKAEELLREVESLLEDIKQKPNPGF